MHVTCDLSHEVCVIHELFVFGREKFRFVEVFLTISDSKRSHGLLSVNVISIKSSSLTSCTAGS